jgi:hypothetical protein
VTGGSEFCFGVVQCFFSISHANICSEGAFIQQYKVLTKINGMYVLDKLQTEYVCVSIVQLLYKFAFFTPSVDMRYVKLNDFLESCSGGILLENVLLAMDCSATYRIMQETCGAAGELNH